MKALTWTIPQDALDRLFVKRRLVPDPTRAPAVYPNALVQMLSSVAALHHECQRIGVNAQTRNMVSMSANDRIVVPVVIVYGLMTVQNAASKILRSDAMQSPGLTEDFIDRNHQHIPSEPWSSSIPFFLNLVATSTPRRDLALAVTTRLERDQQHSNHRSSADPAALIPPIEQSLQSAADLLKVGDTFPDHVFSLDPNADHLSTLQHFYDIRYRVEVIFSLPRRLSSLLMTEY